MRPRQNAGRTGGPRGCLSGLTVGALAVAAHGLGGGGFPGSAELALLLLISALAGWIAVSGPALRRWLPTERLPVGRITSARFTSSRRSTSARRLESADSSTSAGQNTCTRRVVSGRRILPDNDGKSRGPSSFGRTSDSARPGIGCERGRRLRLLTARKVDDLGRWSAIVIALMGGQLSGHVVLSGLADHGHAHGGGSGALLTPPGDFVTALVPSGWMTVAHTVATLCGAALILIAEQLYTLASSVIRAVVTVPRAIGFSRRPRWLDPDFPYFRFHPNGALGPRAPPVPA